ncbi:MAG: hypothetical protein CVV52_03655 [Spirochaetae bacterium HGW-Spirochaetae-8]|jgi:imidazolonepropionase-like amidohydrolase|nr:MAG: hypothetical protein CVV52_03655 [Spirochaetae bacterium HGW-Spirochaetae-8]
MLLIRNINIVSMRNRTVDYKQSVILNDGIIQAIGRNLPTPPEPCQILDGDLHYLIPGLINMHIHLGDNPDDLALYLANGITTVRNMWGHEHFNLLQWMFGTRLFNHLQLKRKTYIGDIFGPDIYTCGPLLDGAKPFFPKFMGVEALDTMERTRKVIQQQVDQGYDFLKIYSKLSRPAFDWIMEEAQRCGIPVCGHVPDDVGLEHALNSKMRSVEHLYGFVNPYDQSKNLDEEAVRRMAALAASRGVWNCPTLVANERLGTIAHQQEYEQEPQMAYVSVKNLKGMRFLMREANKVFEKDGGIDHDAYMERLFGIVRVLKEEGAGILLGTDKAVPYVVAGFSEHHEMELLAKAGLDNYEILAAATVHAASCLGKDAEIGTVEIGKRANLVLTQKNPLEDITTVATHAGVIKAGQWFSRAECDGILAKVEQNISRGRNS